MSTIQVEVKQGNILPSFSSQSSDKYPFRSLLSAMRFGFFGFVGDFAL